MCVFAGAGRVNLGFSLKNELHHGVTESTEKEIHEEEFLATD